MNCPQCESVLLVEVFGASNPIRCPACGNVSQPTNQDATEVSRFARRSFWLGISSILLLFLTGIPAIWYGIRSLLQMRFVRYENKDRKAAAIGVALGTVFGVLGTGIVVLVGGFAVMIMMLIEETKDPQQIQEIAASIGTIDLPSGFQPIEATGLRGQFTVINWKDGTKASDAQARARLIKAIAKAPNGKIQVTRSRDDFDLHGNIKVDSENKQVETVSWQFAGESRDVEKTIEAAEDGEFNTIRYLARDEGADDEHSYALIVVVRDPGTYSEQDVQNIFESFQPTE